MSQEPVEKITDEDHLMLIKLIASLNLNNFRDELDGSELISTLDMIHSIGGDICIIWGSSLYISYEDYFYRVSLLETSLTDGMFDAIHDFSLWYLNNKTNEPTNKEY